MRESRRTVLCFWGAKPLLPENAAIGVSHTRLQRLCPPEKASLSGLVVFFGSTCLELLVLDWMCDLYGSPPIYRVLKKEWSITREIGSEV